MEILVCVKRVPTVGGAITLTADRRAIDTKMSGFTISPHEECAVEEAVRLVERFGGAVTGAALGAAAAEGQLRARLGVGVGDGGDARARCRRRTVAVLPGARGVGRGAARDRAGRGGRADRDGGGAAL